MAGSAKKIWRRAGGAAGRLRLRAKAWKRKRLPANARVFEAGMRRGLEEAKSYLAVAIDAEGRVRHQSEIPKHVAPGIEKCVKELAVLLNTGESIVARGRSPSIRESARSWNLQSKIMREKRKKLVKEHGTVKEGTGRKYYIEFLVNERLVPLLKSVELQREALLRFLKKEGNA